MTNNSKIVSAKRVYLNLFMLVTVHQLFVDYLKLKRFWECKNYSFYHGYIINTFLAVTMTFLGRSLII